MIVQFQKDLYDALIKLTEAEECFYYSDHEWDNQHYRIFNYRMASYSDFLLEGALECRGIMFSVTEPGPAGEVIALKSLPMGKFFNMNENPFVMDLDLTQVESAMVKADGSLISSYAHDEELRLKSKGSLESEQAVAAMEWMNLPENATYKKDIAFLDSCGFTVNMEYCSPSNRIVLSYEKSQLIILNARNRVDGTYLSKSSVEELTPSLVDLWVEEVEFDTGQTLVDNLENMTGMEGYVVKMKGGLHFKLKCPWYLIRHHTKDSINSPRRLFEAVLGEATDDMRTLFEDDDLAIATIEAMEVFVAEKYNHMVDVVERFYERNKQLTQKEYAILGQGELSKMFFGLAMSKYNNKPVNYKEFMAKRWKQYGLTDLENMDE